VENVETLVLLPLDLVCWFVPYAVPKGGRSRLLVPVLFWEASRCGPCQEQAATLAPVAARRLYVMPAAVSSSLRGAYCVQGYWRVGLRHIVLAQFMLTLPTGLAGMTMNNSGVDGVDTDVASRVLLGCSLHAQMVQSDTLLAGLLSSGHVQEACKGLSQAATTAKWVAQRSSALPMQCKECHSQPRHVTVMVCDPAGSIITQQPRWLTDQVRS